MNIYIYYINRENFGKMPTKPYVARAERGFLMSPTFHIEVQKIARFFTFSTTFHIKTVQPNHNFFCLSSKKFPELFLLDTFKDLR